VLRSRGDRRFGLRLQAAGSRSAALLSGNGPPARALGFRLGGASFAGHLSVLFAAVPAVGRFAAANLSGCGLGAALAVGATHKRQHHQSQTTGGDFSQPLPPVGLVAFRPLAGNRRNSPAFKAPFEAAFEAAAENRGRQGAGFVLGGVLGGVLDWRPRGGDRVCWAGRGWLVHWFGKVHSLWGATEERKKRP
jgi:hypothetical protein